MGTQLFCAAIAQISGGHIEHGLTTGHLDEEALFYLRSRGMDKEEARLLLLVAFTSDVVELIRIPTLQDRLMTLIDKRFRGELMRCGNCNVCK